MEPGDVISYLAMCQEEHASLQRGMNFRLRGARSVLLMSQRPSAPYADQVEDDGKVLIYEGHDAARVRGGPDPKKQDQPTITPAGRATQNALFFNAARAYQEARAPAEAVRVYEKIRQGIWVFNGLFNLVKAWQETSRGRLVYKFRLEFARAQGTSAKASRVDPGHTRLIPSEVKRAVWKRDKGRCVLCGRTDNLHFDHIIPFSRGGSSLVAENIQLLCARHNLAKHDRIE